VLAAAASVLEIPALASLAPTPQVDLVDRSRVVLGRDEPNTVLEADFFGVLLVELLAAKDAGGYAGDVLETFGCGGGWARWLR